MLPAQRSDQKIFLPLHLKIPHSGVIKDFYASYNKIPLDNNHIFSQNTKSKQTKQNKRKQTNKQTQTNEKANTNNSS